MRIPLASLRISLFFSFTFFCASVVFALELRKGIIQYVHNVWDVEDGLPENSILSILQTRDGYLWLATFEGLVRFDGVRFSVFDKGNTNEIISNQILALFEDRDRNLWIGTSSGLTRFKDGKFSVFDINKRFGKAVNSIIEGHDGSLWFGTDSGGLLRFKDGTVSTYTTKEGLSNNGVRALYEDRSKNLWIGTWGGGLSRFENGKLTTYTTQNGLSNDIVRAICQDNEGNVWIGTWGGGLSRFKNGKFTTFGVKDGLSNDFVMSVYPTGDSLWIGTRNGLNHFQGGRFTTYTTKDGLSNDMARSIYEDREGSLWVGTYGGGLNRFKEGKFTVYTTTQGLSHDVIRSVYQDRRGAVWIGTDGGGLNRFEDGNFVSYTKKEGLSSNSVYSIDEDHEGTLWIGTDIGLNAFRNGVFSTYTRKEGLSGDLVLSIFEDRTRDLWIGTDEGLNRFRDGKFTIYTRMEGLPGKLIRCISEDHTGNLWIATDGGLARFRNEQFTSYTTLNGLAFNSIYSIYEDAQQNLWIGTDGGGLSRFKDGKFTTWSSRNGLFDDVIYQILEDDQGNLWMSCNKGIFSVKKNDLDAFASGQITSLVCNAYGTGDGMKSRECNGGNQPAGWKSHDGRLWFPTVRGVAVVDPRHLKLNQIPPPVKIEQVVVDGDSILPTRKVDFSPGRERFEFHYTGLSFLAPEKVRFKYKLEGFDKDWINADVLRTAYYTGLPPGNYRFRVIACNNDGVWNQAGATFEFYLTPYFYQTRIFYVSCAFMVGLFAWSFYRLRIKGLKARERELAFLVEDRTQELKKLNDVLQGMATTDELTGIANLRRFREFLDTEWRRAMRSNTCLSLIMIDIDFFKKYNDTYGHQKGDECLRRVADKLRTAINRPTDLIARYGGEEFVAVLGETSAKGATTVAERMRIQVDDLSIPHEGSILHRRVTISLGVATMIPSRDSSPSALIVAADKALYEAKKEGRNRIKEHDWISLP